MIYTQQRVKMRGKGARESAGKAVLSASASEMLLTAVRRLPLGLSEKCKTQTTIPNSRPNTSLYPHEHLASKPNSDRNNASILLEPVAYAIFLRVEKRLFFCSSTHKHTSAYIVVLSVVHSRLFVPVIEQCCVPLRVSGADSASLQPAVGSEPGLKHQRRTV